MEKKSYQFSSQKVSCYFNSAFSQLGQLVDKSQAIVVTDENVFGNHPKKFSGWRTIVIRPGERFKTQATVDYLIERLIGYEADRKSFLVGVGGGVVTDITGYVASIYMRGIRFGFVPSTILAMVDASIGGKNGIDVGLFKNLVGQVRQPEFLLYDSSLLRSLPEPEWVNGFAEIIKHACIKDAGLFRDLEKSGISHFRKKKDAVSDLIRKNVMIKSSIVQRDEFEKSERRLLNFGHTLGHAIENLYKLPHGHAISIGMVAAGILSEERLGFRNTSRIEILLTKYGLPTRMDFDIRKVFEILKMDKKKEKDSMNYVLLEKIGKAVIRSIPLADLEKMIYSIERAR
jgi:3-dehydroquinate synthase